METLTRNHTGADGKLNIEPSVLLNFLDDMKSAETAAPKARKSKTSRDPNKPKQALSAYFYWKAVAGVEMRAKLESEAKPDMKITVGQIAKALSPLWAAMSDDDKAPYVAESNADKERYTSEMETYCSENGITTTNVRRSTKFDYTVEPEVPDGWTGPFDGYLEKTVKDSDGKTFGKSLHSFEEAVETAVRLGAGGITRTPNGFKIRAARAVSINAASRDKNEISWIFNTEPEVVEESNDNSESVVEDEDDVEVIEKNEKPEHSSTCTSHMKLGNFPMKCNCEGSDNNDDSSEDEDEAVDAIDENVEEFEHEGVTYLKDDEGNLYPDTEEYVADPIGKVHEDGRVEFM